MVNSNNQCAAILVLINKMDLPKGFSQIEPHIATVTSHHLQRLGRESEAIECYRRALAAGDADELSKLDTFVHTLKTQLII